MTSTVGVVETKSAFYRTYKESAGVIGSVINEWVMNIVSAVKVRNTSAKGEASLQSVHGVECLFLDSHTAVGDADAASMREMFSTGPSEGSQGIHNMKGIGSRLLISALGGVEHDAADLLTLTVDATLRRGAVARIGPKVDEMWGGGKDMARAAADITFDVDEQGVAQARLSFGGVGGDQQANALAALAEKIVCRSSHPYQQGENDGETKARLCELANECYIMAAAAGNVQKKFTRFLYFNLGSTNELEPDRKPLLQLNDEGRVVCNDTGLLLEEYLRESYVPNDIGIYPLPGIDDYDFTRGRKEILVQKEEIFSEPSFLSSTHTEASTIGSDLIRIDCGDSKEMQMLAYWPSPGGDGWQGHKGSDRLYLHQQDDYFTGTYLVYKDKIINPYNPKSLNTVYDGSVDFAKALQIMLCRDNTGAKAGLVEREDGPLRNWLGFSTWAEWTDAGFPPPQTFKSSSEYDKDRLYEILTLGAIFIVRVDQVVSLDTRKDEIKEKRGSGLSVKEIVFRIRRAQMRWCLDTKPQERVAREAKKAQKLQAQLEAQRGRAAGAALLNLAQLPGAGSEEVRLTRKRPVPSPTATASAGETVPRANGRGASGGRKTPKKHQKAVFPQAIAQRLEPVNKFISQMALAQSAGIDANTLRQERDQLLQLWSTARTDLEKGYHMRWSTSLAVSSSAVAASGSAAGASSSADANSVEVEVEAVD